MKKNHLKYGKCAIAAFLGMTGGMFVQSVSAAELAPIISQMQITEKEGASGDANSLGRYNHVFTGSQAANLSVAENRADWIIKLNGKEINPNDYLSFTCTADGFRTHTINPTDYAIAASYQNGNRWVISSVRASDKNEEIPNNTNLFFLPQSSPLEKGMFLTASQAVEQLQTFFAEGNFNPMDGVLIANAGLPQSVVQSKFSYNPDYVITSSIDTANGAFRLSAMDNSGSDKTGNSDYTMNYVFIPHGTEGTVTGGANFFNMDGGYRPMAYGGDGYSINVLGTGMYQLTLDGYTPKDGILMITGSHHGASADNVFSQSVSEDGNSFIIYSADMHGSKTFTETDRQHGAFNFAFIAYDAALEAPEKGQYRPGFDPGGRDVAGANLALGNTKAPLDFQSSTDYFTVSEHNDADYYLAINGNGLSSGNAFVTPSQNDTRIVPQSVWNSGVGTLYMSTVNPNGNETNSSISVGYFSNSSDLWENGYLNASGALSKRTSGYDAAVTTLADGLRNLKIEDVDARTDGILLAIGRDNNGNWLTSAAPQEDGSWNLSTYTANEGAGVNKSLDFVYLPYGGGDGGENGGWISGWVDSEDGSTHSSFGYFGMEKLDEGVFELTLGDGLTADDGYLLLGLAGDETGANSKGLISYEATEDGTLLINVFDIGANGALADQDFMFAFFANDGSFQTQVPEPSAITLLILGACSLLVLRKKK